jgi:hypothetical protein
VFSEFAGGGRRRWSPKSTGTDLLGVKTRLCHIGRHTESLSTVCFIVDDPPARLLACVGRPRLLPFRGSAAGYVWFDFSSKRITIYLCTVPLCYLPASDDLPSSDSLSTDLTLSKSASHKCRTPSKAGTFSSPVDRGKPTSVQQLFRPQHRNHNVRHR